MNHGVKIAELLTRNNLTCWYSDISPPLLHDLGSPLDSTYAIYVAHMRFSFRLTYTSYDTGKI